MLLKDREAEAEAAKQEVDRLVQAERSRNGQSNPDPDGKPEVKETPILITHSRRLDRFRDRPEKSSDLSIQEWIADARGQLATRPFSEKERCAFLIDHLAGKAPRNTWEGRKDS